MEAGSRRWLPGTGGKGKWPVTVWQVQSQSGKMKELESYTARRREYDLNCRLKNDEKGTFYVICFCCTTTKKGLQCGSACFSHVDTLRLNFPNYKIRMMRMISRANSHTSSAVSGTWYLHSRWRQVRLAPPPSTAPPHVHSVYALIKLDDSLGFPISVMWSRFRMPWCLLHLSNFSPSLKI